MAGDAGAADPSSLQSTFQPPSSGSRKKQERDACWPRWPLNRCNEEGSMVRERSELEQRRGQLTRSLPGLSENRADTYRRNNDALALDRAAVNARGSLRR